MAIKSRRFSELPVTDTLVSTDRVLVLTNATGNGAAVTKTAAITDLVAAASNPSLPTANSTNLGCIKIGDGLEIDANGVVTAPINLANTSAPGAVTIGKGLAINANGVVSLAVRTVPTSAIATGTKGETAIDQQYLYVCVDTNSWKRVTLQDWL